MKISGFSLRCDITSQSVFQFIQKYVRAHLCLLSYDSIFVSTEISSRPRGFYQKSPRKRSPKRRPRRLPAFPRGPGSPHRRDRRRTRSRPARATCRADATANSRRPRRAPTNGLRAPRRPAEARRPETRASRLADRRPPLVPPMRNEVRSTEHLYSSVGGFDEYIGASFVDLK